MAWQPTLYSLVGFGAAFVSAIVALQAWHHRSEVAARPFMALMLALSGWSFTYAVQLGFTTRPEQMLWQRAALAVAGTVPTLWLLFTLQYAGKDGTLTRGKQALLAADPVVFATLTMTNHRHGLVLEDAMHIPLASPRVVTFSFEAGYYVHIVYAYLLVASGAGLLLVVFGRDSKLYRKQAALLILGCLPPFATHVAFTLRLPWGPLPALDLTPFAFVITGVLFGLALFEFDLLERAPIARQRALGEMGDGLLVLDTDGTVVEANSVARRVLDPTPDVGTSIVEIAPTEVDTVEAALRAIHGTPITATIDGRRRTFDADWSRLTDHHGSVAGHVFALRDVTDRKEYEQRLEVAQRVLRHNLRNDMNVIRGWAEQIEETSTDGTADAAGRIVRTADQLIELSEKTRQMVTREHPTTEWVEVDAVAELTTLLEAFQQSHPETRFEYECPTDARISLPDEAFLETAIGNLLENAVEHNDTDEKLVSVRVTQAGSNLQVRVADNGPGIPEMERTILETETETPLEHGSGIGLWLTHWRITSIGGTVTFDDREPRGSVVTVTLPATNGSSADSTAAP